MTTQTAARVGEYPQVISHPPESPRPRGVLVVDDEETIRRMLGYGMSSHGFTVFLAANGSEAVELFQRHRETIDVVLLDVRMADYDGPETLALLRKLDSDIRCCFMSGETGEYSKENLLDLGAACVFQKPFRLNDLAQRLRLVAARKDHRDAIQDDRSEDNGGGTPASGLAPKGV